MSAFFHVYHSMRSYSEAASRAALHRVASSNNSATPGSASSSVYPVQERHVSSKNDDLYVFTGREKRLQVFWKVSFRTFSDQSRQWGELNHFSWCVFFLFVLFFLSKLFNSSLANLQPAFFSKLFPCEWMTPHLHTMHYFWLLAAILFCHCWSRLLRFCGGFLHYRKLC